MGGTSERFEGAKYNTFKLHVVGICGMLQIHVYISILFYVTS